MGYYGLWNATDQVPLRAVDSGEIDRFGTLDPTERRQHTPVQPLGRLPAAISATRCLQANLHAVKYRLDLFSNFTYFLDDPVNGDQFEQLDDRWQLGTSGHVSWTATQSAIAAALTGGWEARHDRIDPVGLYHTAARERLATIRKDFVRETSGGRLPRGRGGAHLLAAGHRRRALRPVLVRRDQRRAGEFRPGERGTPLAEGSRRSSAPWPGRSCSRTSVSGSTPTTPAG